MKRKWLLIALITLGAIILYVLDISEEPTEPTANDQMLVGLSFDSLVVERWKRDLETFVSQANELGMEVSVQIANDDVDEQRKQISFLIEQNVKVLVILPNEADAFSDLVREAKQKGIYVISYDRLMSESNVDLYISFDNEGIGYEISKYLLENLPEKEETRKLLIINGDPADNNSFLLNQGFYRALNQAENIEIVDEVWASEWREDYAYDAIENLYSKGIPIDGVIAANDVLAGGAIEALITWKEAEGVLVVSQDAELSACQRIVEGLQLATVLKPINLLASRAADISLALIQEDQMKVEASIWDGAYQVPYVQLDFSLVSRDNIEKTVIESGFHTREDVYRNVLEEKDEED